MIRKITPRLTTSEYVTRKDPIKLTTFGLKRHLQCTKEIDCFFFISPVVINLNNM